MSEYELWMGGQTDRHTNTHINTMTWAGLGLGQVKLKKGLLANISNTFFDQRSPVPWEALFVRGDT